MVMTGGLRTRHFLSEAALSPFCPKCARNSPTIQPTRISRLHRIRVDWTLGPAKPVLPGEGTTYMTPSPALQYCCTAASTFCALQHQFHAIATECQLTRLCADCAF